MRSANPSAPSRFPIRRRGGALSVVVIFGLGLGGCARDRHEITPTTLGTHLKRMPRGKMTPFPWPGVDLVKTKPRPNQIGGPKTDPEASIASGESSRESTDLVPR